MSKRYCGNCGTKLCGGVCQWCQEELYIFDNQIYPSDDNFPLSQEFIDTVKEQREQVKAGINL